MTSNDKPASIKAGFFMGRKTMKKNDVPLVKPMLVPFINENHDGIRVGGYQANITREIYVDEVEKFYSLMTDMDGSQSFEKLKEKYNLTEMELLSIIESLKNSGILYKNDPSEYSFTDEEKKIYSRNLNFFAWIDVDGQYLNYWEPQSLLKSANVLVLGAGGTGSHTTEALARLGVGNITVVDFDTVELSNLNRQNFEYNDVGKLKTAALKERIERVNPYINIKTVTKKISSAKDITEVGTNFNIVISCIDKPNNSTDILDEYSQANNIPWVLGGYASTILNNGIYGKNEMKFSEYLKLERSENYDARSVDENKDWVWDNAVIAPVAVISGYMSSLYALYFITGLKKLEFGRIQHIDLFNIQNLQDFSYILGVGDK